MAQSPDDSGWPVPPSAPPVDEEELHDAIRFIEAQGKNRQGNVGVGFGCFWPSVGLGLLFLGIIYYMYQWALSSGDLQLVQSFPFPPPFQLSFLIMLVLGVVIGVHIHKVAKHTRDYERYEISDRLADSSIATDLMNRKLDFTMIYSQTKGSSCLWWLGPHLKAKTQSEKTLSILARDLHSYINYSPRSFLSNRNTWELWDNVVWVTFIVLITVWAFTGAGHIVYLELVLGGYIALGPLKSVPWTEFEAVNF